MGRFLFPIGQQHRQPAGPSDVVSRTSAELDRMTPEEIRVYENNMVLKHRLKDSRGSAPNRHCYASKRRLEMRRKPRVWPPET